MACPCWSGTSRWQPPPKRLPTVALRGTAARQGWWVLPRLPLVPRWMCRPPLCSSPGRSQPCMPCCGTACRRGPAPRGVGCWKQLRHAGRQLLVPQGENLAWGHPSFTAATDAWYSEESQYNYGRGGFSSATGHFTQVRYTVPCPLLRRHRATPSTCSVVACIACALVCKPRRAAQEHSTAALPMPHPCQCPPADGVA